MPLPKISYPTFEVYVKSLDRKVKFRPFLVKEEKMFLMAKEADEFKDVFDTLKQIATNCCLEDIDFESLPSFDLEMIFLHLRINSIGDKSELSYTCNNVIESKNEETGEVIGNQCGHVNVFDLDLKNVQYDVPEGHTNIIRLTDKLGIVMKYPNMETAKEILSNAGDTNDIDGISLYIDHVFDEDQKYTKDSFSKEELTQFMESLTLTQLQKIRAFFETSPTVVLKQIVVS